MNKITDYVRYYYLEKGYNCAETILLSAGEAWNLHLPKDAQKFMAGFGGGMACGITCGAISGGIAALSYQFVTESGHKSPELMALTRTFIRSVRMELGSEECKFLKAKYTDPTERCLPTIIKIAEILEILHTEFCNQHNI